MLHTLTSNALTVTVSNTGAELHSIKSNKSGDEYLWQGDPAIWGSRAPVLFPIIGGLKNGQFQYNGNTYALSKHGFVRTAYFQKSESADGNMLIFEYVDNPSTRKIYPFAFTFQIEYNLQGSILEIAYRVQNETNGEMLFSVGAHEGFRCPRHTNESFDDYYLEFDRDGSYASYPVSPNGLLTDVPYTVIEQGCVLPLKHSLFENDALIFKNIAAKKVAVKSIKSPAIVEVTYDSDNLGIWTKVGAPFICIEPWCGLPDREETDGAFINKEGIIRLAEGESYTFRHSINIIEP